ncbi:MAG TPA: DUF1349 domain-containing protein [Candidatus Dormibacteraeota bacterium]|nr:DUF1349 domain-containing protein [Candidatus Dormibacteraeota bacterium]
MVQIPGVPGRFGWIGTPVATGLQGGVLSISAGPGTDWFVDPGSGQVRSNAPALVATVPGDFTLSARVEVAFESTFDAGALVLWSHEHSWAKLAFERSPQGQPMVVSVVTRGESDDCNSVGVEGGKVWLRVASFGLAHAFHMSLDGRRWQYVRRFRLGSEETPAVGFAVQSPLGDGCSARFLDLSYLPGTLSDLRNGT